VLLKEFNLPAIYTGQWYWKNFGSEDEYYKQLQLWLAYVDGGWPAPAIIPKPWDYASWVQFTWTLDGKKYGAESDGLDGNWFNGTLEELYTLYGLPEMEVTDTGTGYGEVSEWNDALDAVIDCVEKLTR